MKKKKKDVSFVYGLHTQKNPNMLFMFVFFTFSAPRTRTFHVSIVSFKFLKGEKKALHS